MSRIDELIAQHCPDGVENKSLGEVGEFIRGSGLQKKDLFDEGVPAIHYGQIHTRYGVWTDRTLSFASSELAAKLRHARHGDLLIATTSEDDEAVAKATAWLGGTDVVLSSDAYIYRHSLDPRYVSYFFQSEHFQDQKRKHISGTKVRRISGTSLAKILIPVPPLEVQRAIVEVLDTFSKLEAELEAELEARKQQYEHYRDALLEFSDAIVRAPLGDIGTIFGGLTGKSKADFSDGNARFASYRNVFQNISLDLKANDYVQVKQGEKQRSLAFGDVIFTGSSESLEEVGMASAVTDHLSEPMYLNSFCIGFRPNDTAKLNPEFAKHLFRSRSMRALIKKTASGVTRINVSKARLSRVLVPLPPPATQERVAHILDQFESLTNSLSAGLPAELAARRQQYEYYRDKLLTFKELEVAA